VRRRSRHVAKLNMGEAKDDIHVCIMCLRAIMNNKVMDDFCEDLIAKKSLKTCLLYFRILVVCFRIIMFTVCVVGSCVFMFVLFFLYENIAETHTVQGSAYIICLICLVLYVAQ